MAVPKRRTSRSNTRSRRAHWKSSRVRTAPCPQCREQKVPHAVCPVCGMYNGRQVVEVV